MVKGEVLETLGQAQKNDMRTNYTNVPWITDATYPG